jgi:hypothetical protein
MAVGESGYDDGNGNVFRKKFCLCEDGGVDFDPPKGHLLHIDPPKGHLLIFQKKAVKRTQ